MKKLKTLANFNDERSRGYEVLTARTRPNGIACPNCGAELHDSDPSVTLTSNPPRKHVHCESCFFTGTRIA